MKNKIKQISVTLFSVALLSANAVHAQDVPPAGKPVRGCDEATFHKHEFGLRYLPTFTTLSFRNSSGDVVEGSATLSNGFGVMFAHNFNQIAGLQLEFNYDRISQKYKDMGLDKRVSINYINIPFLLALNTPKSCRVVLGVVAGPQFGINIGSKIDSESGGNGSDTLHAMLAVKPGDVGLAYGAGLGIVLDNAGNIRADVGYRAVYGLVDMSGSSSGANSYNVLVKGSRKSKGGYVGITFLF